MYKERNPGSVLKTIISPFRELRDSVRELCNNFMEIHLATPLEYCERIGYNNLYSRAGKAEVKHRGRGSGI